MSSTKIQQMLFERVMKEFGGDKEQEFVGKLEGKKINFDAVDSDDEE